MEPIDLSQLGKPFDLSDLEWRVMRSGDHKDKGIWAMVTVYVTARAVMGRLDDVCGPGRWQNAYKGIDDSLSCGIGIKVGDEWVWKWDGAGHLEANAGLDENSAAKGDYSNAFKRAGVHWDIARYLYSIPAGYAKVHEGGTFRGKCMGADYRWDPPDLPSWIFRGDDAVIPLRSQIQKLLDQASEAGNASPDEAGRIGRLLANVNTHDGELFKTREILTGWIAEGRKPKEATA